MPSFKRITIIYMLLHILSGCKWLNEGVERIRIKAVVEPKNSKTAFLKLKAYTKYQSIQINYINTGNDLKPKDSIEIRMGTDLSTFCNEMELVWSGEVNDPQRLNLRIEKEQGYLTSNKPVKACLIRTLNNKQIVVSSAIATDEDPAAPIPEAAAIYNYGRVCQEAISEIPTMNCFDGQLMPILLEGKEVRNLAPNADCDNPVEIEMPFGQCVPGSRVLVLPKTDPDVDVVLICRKYEVRPMDSPIFDDISIIQHRKSTGATCFFQMPYRKTNGTRIPSPTEAPKDTPKGAITAQDFWMTPTAAAGRECITCHDSDPFIHNPWIGQHKQLPSQPQGKYVILGKAFANWPESQSVNTTTPNNCTQCHRIGSMKTCDTMGESVGRTKSANLLPNHFKFPEAYWMPPNHNAGSLTEWNAKFEQDFLALEKCCMDDKAPGCVRSNLSENRGW